MIGNAIVPGGWIPATRMNLKAAGLPAAFFDLNRQKG
jgi:hypothetical protein